MATGEQKPGELAPEKITVHGILAQHHLEGMTTLEQRDALLGLAQDGELDAGEMRVLELAGYLA